MTKIVIAGTGSALPDNIVKNDAFSQHHFYEKTGQKSERTGAEMAAKLESITGIRERRYIRDEDDSVPLMALAAAHALEDAGMQANDLQGIIVAHNAGNMLAKGHGFHPVPNLAAHLKHALAISKYEFFAYDILFGCPGWIQAVIQAQQTMLQEAGPILVVGLEVASRMLDPHDPDSMILADGCGACVLNVKHTEQEGILAHSTFSHAQDDLNSIYLGASCMPGLEGHSYFKMNGRAVYKYATQWVPQVIKKALEKAGKDIEEVDIFLFHQANAKMLEAITQNIAALYNLPQLSFAGKVPATIAFLGNTSVATIPTMLDLIRKNQLAGYQIKKGQLAVMASVGAGMHCNALVYQF
jgi:3-oxoacyl-[acyl-carrier-protein] synthase-3